MLANPRFPRYQFAQSAARKLVRARARQTGINSRRPLGAHPVFRFSIRDVLWLTVSIALALGWWRDHHDNLYLRNRLLQADMDMAKDLGMAKLRAIAAEKALEKAKAAGEEPTR